MTKAKKQQRQDIRLAITPKGDEYFRQLVEIGFINLTPSEKLIEWDILHDLTLQFGDAEGVKMSVFLMTGRDTILGRKFADFPDGERGQLATASYGRTLRRLIGEGYIKAWIHQSAKKEE